MIVRADARSIPLRDGSVQCVVTSPPYWGLRDYGTGVWDGGDAECEHRQGRPGAGRADGIVDERYQRNRDGAGAFSNACYCGARRIDRQIGLESTPDEYVATMVGVFREVCRVLRDDGTVWLNLGDSYAHNGACDGGTLGDGGISIGRLDTARIKSAVPLGLKPKDLCGLPWRVAFALQADGWYLRSDIIWAKPNPMPESVTDRPTRSHEYLFLLSKRATYYYDADAIREPATYAGEQMGVCRGTKRRAFANGLSPSGNEIPGADANIPNARNKRDVWTVNSEPTPEAHFATFPQKLVEPCILAGTSEKGCCAVCGAPRVRELERTVMVIDRSERTHALGRTRSSGTMLEPPTSITTGRRPSCAHDAPSVPCVVFDPFLGSGTVGKVCERLGRRWVGLELSAPYIEIAKARTAQMGLWT